MPSASGATAGCIKTPRMFPTVEVISPSPSMHSFHERMPAGLEANRESYVFVRPLCGAALYLTMQSASPSVGKAGRPIIGQVHAKLVTVSLSPLSPFPLPLQKKRTKFQDRGGTARPPRCAPLLLLPQCC